ncbi:MAG: sigma-70 family RNA polymerase sigma factor [Verrucomicrobiales bacterium]|nr:sigma-70 family RNA polymerase sigma factor [Verrucomicrobiales bacterium]
MTAVHDEDASLMLRVQQGELGAFEQLVERHRQPIFNFVQRMIHDPAETEDVAQQVFVQVWKAADRYRVASRFTTWLFTIARNLCLNELRRRGRHPTESLEAEHDTGESTMAREFEDVRNPGVAEEVMLGELTVKIEEALAALPESQRAAILLFREQEMPYEEIARVLEVSVSATKSLIHRGRETLKARLKAYLRTGAWDSSEAAAETFPGNRV